MVVGVTFEMMVDESREKVLLKLLVDNTDSSGRVKVVVVLFIFEDDNDVDEEGAEGNGDELR